MSRCRSKSCSRVSQKWSRGLGPREASTGWGVDLWPCGGGLFCSSGPHLPRHHPASHSWLLGPLVKRHFPVTVTSWNTYEALTNHPRTSKAGAPGGTAPVVGMVRQAGCGEGSEGVRSHARNPSDSPSKGPCPCAGPASSYVFALEAKLGRHGGPTRMGSAHTLAGGTQGKGAGVEPHRLRGACTAGLLLPPRALVHSSLEKLSRLDQTTQGLRLQLPGKERTR